MGYGRTGADAGAVRWICERCGDALPDVIGCRCRTPYDPVAVRRRHREAVHRAQLTDRRVTRRDTERVRAA